MSGLGFGDLVALARTDPGAFREIPREQCLAAAKSRLDEGRATLRMHHRDGESGGTVINRVTALGDEILLGAFEFALAQTKRPDKTRRQLALVALGGYGRRQLNPFSDLDVTILRPAIRREGIERVAQFLGPFIWDLGWENSIVPRTLRESIDLAKADLRVYTGMLHARLLAGDEKLYGELRYRIGEFGPRDRPADFAALTRNVGAGSAATRRDGLYALEPNIKEGAGALRDYHQALWLLAAHFKVDSFEQASAQGLLGEEQLLEVEQALDLLWRVRNELHFQAGRREDRLTFQNEQSAACALGYTTAEARDTAPFMRDYYRAARTVLALRDAVGKAVLSQGRPQIAAASNASADGEFAVVDGFIEAGAGDPHWFEESPVRLMSVFWEAARQGRPLGPATLDRVTANLHLAGDTFRSNPLVRRFFVAICGRPLHAGLALRQAAHAGLLGAYLPEFAAIRDVVRYEDFHHYPVDEHTLCAIEALSRVHEIPGAVGNFLKVSLEHLSDPHILVIALLLHDLGKAKGEAHTEEGMHLARQIGQRMGLPEEDIERIAFLVLNHLAMTHIALYRDVDDADIVESFAHAMKSEHRLRTLLLLSYADLSAVGPNVWNDWKGALLLKLFLRTERVLAGHAEVAGEEFWDHPKAAQVEQLLEESLRPRVRAHVQDLGSHYLAAFTPAAIAQHIQCVAEAEQQRVAIRISRSDDTKTTSVVICAPDHVGLFEEVSGCFASQLVDIQEANLFTLSGGTAVDCFRAVRAGRGDALTEAEMESLARVLKLVVSGQRRVESLIEESQRRVYALLHPAMPVRTEIRFDNQASRRFTVIDILSGDRTGLLYDIARAFRERGVDVSHARIVTDARRVRDSFYISCNGGKIEDRAELAAIEETVRDNILGRTAAHIEGGVS